MSKNIFKLFTTTDDENLAFHVTKNTNQVNLARKNLAKKYNFDINNLKYMNQIHGNNVQIVSKEQNLYECDALITNLKDTALMVMVADCIAILFEDTISGIIAVAHAGRNGTFLDISSNVINTMTKEFSCDIKNIKVVMGPSIQKCCYEVSNDLANITATNFGIQFVKNRHIDLQGINKKQLLNIGIIEQNITISSTCTKCDDEPYFSYRKDNSCGRFAGIIMMK